jgi:hypothetical protein
LRHQKECDQKKPIQITIRVSPDYDPLWRDVYSDIQTENFVLFDDIKHIPRVLEIIKEEEIKRMHNYYESSKN